MQRELREQGLVDAQLGDGIQACGQFVQQSRGIAALGIVLGMGQPQHALVEAAGGERDGQQPEHRRAAAVSSPARASACRPARRRL